MQVTKHLINHRMETGSDQSFDGVHQEGVLEFSTLTSMILQLQMVGIKWLVYNPLHPRNCK
jgi:hypothetical protein